MTKTKNFYITSGRESFDKPSIMGQVLRVTSKGQVVRLDQDFKKIKELQIDPSLVKVGFCYRDGEYFCKVVAKK